VSTSIAELSYYLIGGFRLLPQVRCKSTSPHAILQKSRNRRKRTAAYGLYAMVRQQSPVLQRTPGRCVVTFISQSQRIGISAPESSFGGRLIVLGHLPQKSARAGHRFGHASVS